MISIDCTSLIFHHIDIIISLIFIESVEYSVSTVNSYNEDVVGT